MILSLVLTHTHTHMHTHMHTHAHTEFQGLNLSDSGDTDTLGPLPPGGIWSSDGEYSVPAYDYFHHNRSSQNTGSSKSPSPGTVYAVIIAR